MKILSKNIKHSIIEALNIFEWLIREMHTHLISASLVVGFGVSGYMIIEGWSFLDALYMTMITLASIGYMEVHPLSDLGRIFTICLIVLGIGIVAAIFTFITQQIVQRQFSIFFQRKKMKETISSLTNHTIIVGYGRLSRVAAASLRSNGKDLLILEKNTERANEAIAHGYLVLVGDATSDEVLIEAGILRASNLASLLPKDSDNLYVILTSRELAPDLFILSRAEDDAGEKRLKRAGANKILSPFRIGGLKIAEGLLKPNVTDFLDLAVSNSDHSLQIEEIKIPDTSPLIGRSLQEAELRKRTNVIIAAIINSTGEMCFNPGGDALISSRIISRII